MYVIYSFILQAVSPRLPPTEIELKVKSSTTINVSWKAPFLQNSLGITGYQLCIAYVQSDEECDLIVRTKDTKSVVSSLKAATKYRVKVTAKNKVGYGQYSMDYFVMSNGAPPLVIPSEITKESFVIKLEPPRKEIRYCQIVLIILPTNGSLPKSSQYLEDYNSYYDAKASAEPSSYIAAEFDVIDFEKYRVFTVGDAGITSGVVGMSKYGTAVRKYFNGPLSPDTMYTTFLRFYTAQDLVYVSDFLAPIKTKQKDNVNECKKYQLAESKSSQEKFKLPFIIVLVMLLIIFLLLGLVVIYRRHQMQQNNIQFSGDRTGSSTIAQTDPTNDQGSSPTNV